MQDAKIQKSGNQPNQNDIFKITVSPEKKPQEIDDASQ